MMRCHDVKDKIHITKHNEAWLESPRSGARTTAEDTEYQKCTFLSQNDSIDGRAKCFIGGRS